MEWTRERLTRRREPHLRPSVPLNRIEILPAARGEGKKLAAAIAAFRERLETDPDANAKLPAYSRRHR
jgi:hypothetical protein